jgi:hypothetical protein
VSQLTQSATIESQRRERCRWGKLTQAPVQHAAALTADHLRTYVSLPRSNQLKSDLSGMSAAAGVPITLAPGGGVQSPFVMSRPDAQAPAAKRQRVDPGAA